MTIKITQQPYAFTPAYNDIFVVGSSDEVLNYKDFKYVITVDVNGDLFTFNVNPRPDNYFVFNAKEIIKNYIKRSYFNPTVTAPQLASGKTCNVTITANEFYNDALQGNASTTFIAYDACFMENDFRTFDFTNRQIFLYDNIITEFLGADKRITLNTDILFHLNTDNFKTIYCYHNAQNLTKTLDNTTLFNCINVGVQSWITDGLIVNTTMPFYLTLNDNINNTETTFDFKVTDICSKHPINTLYYLKRDGNIGHFHFELVSSKDSVKKVNTVRLGANKLDVLTGLYGSNIFDREKHIVSTEIESTIILNTNWLTESQSVQLEELWSSPIVWLKDAQNNYNPITITDTNYSYKTAVNDKLFNYQIKVEVANKETRQRGI